MFIFPNRKNTGNVPKILIICFTREICHVWTILKLNKKVLLRERKRHTTRRVASACYAALSSDCGGTPSRPGWGPTPIQSSLGWGGGCTPIQSLTEGTPIQSWMVGVPKSSHVQRIPPSGPVTPNPDLGWCTFPSRPGMEYPTSRGGMG